MAKDWDYALMVQDASAAGGPDAWIKTIKENAYNRGSSDMKSKLVMPLLLTGMGLGSVGVIGYQKIKKWIFSKKAANLLTEKEALQAEAFLKKELDEAMRTSEIDNGTESA